MDPYAMLGLSRDAGADQIKSAYRKAAKTAHPDSGGDAEHFSRLKTVYELLQDPIRR